jgi:hypothetical protein
MPFKSKAQQRFMFSAEDRGDFPKGTAMEWAHNTPSIKKLPEKVEHKKTAEEIAMEVVAECACPGMKIRSKGKGRGMATGKGKGPIGVPAGLKSWDTLKAESKKKTASDLANAVLATDGRSARVMHDFYEGGKWAPGGIEYQGPMKLAAELPTNVADRAPMAIGSIIGAPKMKPPKFPSMPKVKKLASEIAELVLQKVAAHGR